MTLPERTRKVLERYFGERVTPELQDFFETRVLQGGEWLFHQGQAGDSLYLLARGRLQAWLEPADHGQARLLGEIVPGDSVGEMSLLSGLPRSAGVRAVRDSLLVRIDRKHFDALAATHPRLVMKLAANVVDMTRRGSTNRYRQPRTLAIVPLDDHPRTAAFGTELVQDLGAYGQVARVDQSRIETVIGSGLDETMGDNICEAATEWLHEQEDQCEFTVFLTAGPTGPWAELAKRQADLIVYVAESTGDIDRASASLAGQEQQDYGAQHALVLLQPGQGQPISGTAKWLDAITVNFHLHLRAEQPEDQARVTRVISGNARGLVLSAGAARGFAHIGVYQAMRELDIPVDWIGGCSIGSIMGAAMAAGWDQERIMSTARQCFVQGKPFSDYTMPVTSLIRGGRMSRLLKEHLGMQLEDLPIPFFCVSSVLDDGSLNLHERGEVAAALCASAAMPGVLPPAVVNRRLSIDGSVLNSLPVNLMQQKPVGHILAVDLSSQKNYEVDYESVPPAWRVLAGRYLPFMKRYRVPALSTIMLKATEIGTLGQMRELGARADKLLQPDVRGFGITEVKTFDRIVDAGYRCAMVELAGWADEQQGEGNRPPSPPK